MIRQIQPVLYQLREKLVCSYLLQDGNEICLIDGGFLRGIKNIEACLKKLGLDWPHISTILLTHGHLDHTYNLAEIQRKSGANVYAHPLDSQHIAGKHPYRGTSRACGLLQRCGRMLFGFSEPEIDQDLADRQTIPFAGGIRVIHTPGHTEGHCCFIWKKHKLLFAGDLFATGHKRTFLPPSFLNSCPERFPESIQTILNLNPSGVLCNHCDKASPTLQRTRFMELVKRLPDA